MARTTTIEPQPGDTVTFMRCGELAHATVVGPSPMPFNPADHRARSWKGWGDQRYDAYSRSGMAVAFTLSEVISCSPHVDYSRRFMNHAAA